MGSTRRSFRPGEFYGAEPRGKVRARRLRDRARFGGGSVPPALDGQAEDRRGGGGWQGAARLRETAASAVRLARLVRLAPLDIAALRLAVSGSMFLRLAVDGGLFIGAELVAPLAS